ncbi:MAG: h [Hydrocarboniphaga sp.]|uniref:EF-hand domain-containing protein n=1 Tax=Hydrocarboniphaga sp. TaxID=2033016 RepID=UPI0026104BA7|nr:EF-hand domain-containing protein [Hydrocarboniphaga sp.]MDB5968287.1 h [Hydrocarboniphaga sp.]
MSNLPSRLLAFALLVSLAACQSDAARQRERSPITFKAFDDADTDHDGKLNREEVLAVPEFVPLAKYFDRIDSDHSGFLSWNEVRAARFPVFREPRLPEH